MSVLHSASTLVGTIVAGASLVAAAAMAQQSGDTSIRPFTLHAPDEALADMRRRIGAAKWPSRELVTDASQGVQLATMRELARYWQTATLMAMAQRPRRGACDVRRRKRETAHHTCPIRKSS